MQVRRLMQILESLPYDAEVLIATDECSNEIKPIWNIVCKYFENSEKIVIIPNDFGDNDEQRT